MTRRSWLPLTTLGLLAAAVLLIVWTAPDAQRAATSEPDKPTTAVKAPSSEAPDPWRAPAELPKYAMVYDHFETIGVEDGLPSERITTVLNEGDRLWAGTDKGLAVRENGRWRVFTTKDGLAHPYITSLAREPVGGDLWISTLAGLSRMSGDLIRTYTQTNSGLMNNVVYHVVAGKGVVWVGTAAGASLFDVKAGTWALYDHENAIMHEPWCYAVAIGPGRMWIGLWGGAIAERDMTTGHWREYRDPDGEMEIELMRDDGPIHEVTSFLCYDAGVLWQSTYFGLARYDGRSWRSYLKKDTGLPADFINHVSSRGHRAWLSTDQGFGVFDGSTCVTYRRRDDGRCDRIVTTDGKETGRTVLGTAPAHNYILWADAGPKEVWLATGKGLTHGTVRGSKEGK